MAKKWSEWRSMMEFWWKETGNEYWARWRNGSRESYGSRRYHDRNFRVGGCNSGATNQSRKSGKQTTGGWFGYD